MIICGFIKRWLGFTWVDAIFRGHAMTALADGVRGVDRLSSDVKCLVIYYGNWLPQTI